MTDIRPEKIAYMEMIQRAIDRMAGESARMKSYALVATAAVLSTAAATETIPIALAGIVLLVVFWVLDAKYLAQERCFRDLYERARTRDGQPDFVMTPDEEIRRRHELLQSFSGWSTAPLYGALILLSLIVATI